MSQSSMREEGVGGQGRRRHDALPYNYDFQEDHSVSNDHDENGGGIDLKHIGFLLLRHSWIILLCILLGGIPVTAWVLRRPVLYRSTGTIMVESKEDKILKTDAFSQESLNSLDYLNTVVRALTSRALLKPWFRKTNLEKTKP